MRFRFSDYFFCGLQLAISQWICQTLSSLMNADFLRVGKWPAIGYIIIFRCALGNFSALFVSKFHESVSLACARSISPGLHC